MSAATKKKIVFQETENNFDLPTEKQQIVKIKGPRGNNLHDVETASGETFIVTMPVKFRKSVWTKRGDFVVVESIDEGNKVKAEIIQILAKDQIRYIKSQNLWPKEFDVEEKAKNNYIDEDMMPSSGEDQYEDEEEIIEENNNEKLHSEKNNKP